MSTAANDQLCEYERQRLVNIARNNAMLAQLGIAQDKKAMHADDRASQAARRVSSQATLRLRATSRLAVDTCL